MTGISRGPDRAALAASREALEALRDGALAGDREARESVRRIVHALGRSAEVESLPEIVAACRALERTSRGNFEVAFDALMAVLQVISDQYRDERKVRILVVEDEIAIAELLAAKLAAPDREVLVARTSAEAEHMLALEPVAAVLLDLILPDADGRNLLARIRENPATAAIPVIVLSARGAARTECFALGVDAFIEKPFDPATVAAAVANKISRAALAERESRTDPLTGLPNRTAFREACLRESAQATRSGKPLSCAVLDIDRFKYVNDTYGHATGDEVLKGLGRIVGGALRKADFIARWGGEEFVALFPDTDEAGAARALEKALESLRAETFRAEDGRTFHVTYSAGVALVPAGSTADDAVAHADKLLYRAKETGRDRVLTTADDEPSDARGGASCILLAEDDDLTAAVVTQKLEHEGFEVVRFADGPSALDAAWRTRFALVLLDAQLPGMNGFEVLQRLRAAPATGTLPIVMLTSLGNESDVVRGLDLGANDYIVKPFSPAELAARIRRALRTVGDATR